MSAQTNTIYVASDSLDGCKVPRIVFSESAK